MTAPGGDPLAALTGKGLVAATGGLINPALVTTVPEGQAGTPLPRRHKAQEDVWLLETFQTANWITYASCATGQLITSIVSTWQVPKAPQLDDGQLIYLFNGLQNANRDQILQPVLQWGNSPSGGGASWAVIPLFVQPSQGIKQSPTGLVDVQEGQSLTGYVRLLGQTQAGYRYECGFQGIQQAPLIMDDVDLMVEAVEVLEAYRITDRQDYPDAASTRFSGISLSNNAGAFVPQWAVTDRVTNYQQHTLLQQDGSIDIHYSAA